MPHGEQPLVREVHTVVSVNEGGDEGGERGMEMQRAGADRAYRCRLRQQGSMGCE